MFTETFTTIYRVCTSFNHHIKSIFQQLYSYSTGNLDRETYYDRENIHNQLLLKPCAINNLNPD